MTSQPPAIRIPDQGREGIRANKVGHEHPLAATRVGIRHRLFCQARHPKLARLQQTAWAEIREGKLAGVSASWPGSLGGEHFGIGAFAMNREPAAEVLANEGAGQLATERSGTPDLHVIFTFPRLPSGGHAYARMRGSTVPINGAAPNQ